MGSGYIILVYDGFGCGLIRINPRLHAEGRDKHGNPVNWWPCDRRDREEDLARRHDLSNYTRYDVIINP